jgi:hypothetical protein
MNHLFYVARHGEQSGPFGLDEIMQKIESKQLELSDYVYDEASQDWVMFSSYPAITERLHTAKPSAPPTLVAEPQPVKATEWYVLKGDNKFGPFMHAEVVKLLQDKSVFEFDYVWHAGLTSWQRIAEIADFKPEQLKHSNVKEVFFRRKHPRIAHTGSLIVHDGKKLWKGRSLEISEGGAGLIMENLSVNPGHSLYIHFKPGDDLPAFAAYCDVVSRTLVNPADPQNSAVRYGVKFSKLDSHAEQTIKHLTQTKKSA